MSDATEPLAEITRLAEVIANTQASAALLESEYTERIAELLPRLPDDVLLALAEGCSVEQDETHCWRCIAWGFWADRNDI